MKSSVLEKYRDRVDERQQSLDPKVDVLGIMVDATNLPSATAKVLKWIATGAREYVCVAGVHGIMESLAQPKLKPIFNEAGLVTPDGMPLVYISRAVGHSKCGRVYGPDLMLDVCRESVRFGYKHFFYGTTPQTLSSLEARLRIRFPGLRVAGSYAPPFGPLSGAETADVIASINKCGPDIVWVGLGTPKQEKWMADHRAFISAPVLIGVGAAFDFHSGRVRQAPTWMQPLCLEWLFRLFVEPRRLWKRYLTNNPKFVFFLALQQLGLRRF